MSTDKFAPLEDYCRRALAAADIEEAAQLLFQWIHADNAPACVGENEVPRGYIDRFFHEYLSAIIKNYQPTEFKAIVQGQCGGQTNDIDIGIFIGWIMSDPTLIERIVARANELEQAADKADRTNIAVN